MKRSLRFHESRLAGDKLPLPSRERVGERERGSQDQMTTAMR
jgi:hypothetical protein